MATDLTPSSRQARDAKGDLAPVGDQDLLEHRALRLRLEVHEDLLELHGVAVLDQDLRDLAALAGATSFISFIASTMHTVWPTSTTSPTSANGFEPGCAER